MDGPCQIKLNQLQVENENASPTVNLVSACRIHIKSCLSTSHVMDHGSWIMDGWTSRASARPDGGGSATGVAIRSRPPDRSEHKALAGSMGRSDMNRERDAWPSGIGPQ